MSSESINGTVFHFLEGEWLVRRQFEGSYVGSFNGKARLLLDEASGLPTYNYSEHGELTDGTGQLFNAKQSYLYRLVEGRLEVLKQEGSDWILMHELDFRQEGKVIAASAAHTHLCGQDYYAAEYRIDLSGRWEVAYNVTGPKKDYRIYTVYER